MFHLRLGEETLGWCTKRPLEWGEIVAIKKLITSNIIQYHDNFDKEVRILGVMILELVMGRRPVEYGDDDVVVFSDYVNWSKEIYWIVWIQA
ncbi:hypothetical protein MRB53_030297 [Persea americana]|uniref:Uncharacterized protein n=1 Tax=Persea americana TaxID=3435 RepID=A0ACC2KL58_PERAE|nr:hypothetical protein MRB53_030297 [Persea americana]